MTLQNELHIENETPVEVYFDDFKVTQVKSPIIATDDYYPGGAVSIVIKEKIVLKINTCTIKEQVIRHFPPAIRSLY